jgi:hypothetical protein
MSRPYAITLPVSDTVAAAAAVQVSHLTEKVVQVRSYTSGTYQLQVSIDGTNFNNYGTAFTAVGFLEVPFYAHSVRLNTTVGGTGTLAVVGGVQQPD